VSTEFGSENGTSYAGQAAYEPPVALGPPALRVRHLWHRFGHFDVLRDVCFEVPQGEIFGFIGPNGAGKTTTIRIMATLLEPMAGRVEVDGIDVTVDPEAVRRVIGYMPDHAGVYERVTVREYLEFFADAFRVPSATVVDAVLELTDLGPLSDKLVATMSKGQKQRLQLARILLHDPKVLILDEPASDLDPRARIEMRNLLLELRSLGKTILLSSHILTELSDVCTSVGILERGRILVCGPIGEIGARLEAQRAAQAIGHAPPPANVQGGPTHPGQVHAGQLHGGQVHPGVLVGAQQQVPMAPPVPQASIAVRRRVKLKVLGQPEYVASLLRGGPGVVDIELSYGTVVVTIDGPEARIADMVAHLVRNNVGILGVEQERNELERIFLEVTRGEMQ
jgi:ABC-2 type transport system ATP-binding protein